MTIPRTFLIPAALTFACFSFTLTGCRSSRPDTAHPPVIEPDNMQTADLMQAANLDGREFLLRDATGFTPLPDFEVHLVFDEGYLRLWGTCNTHESRYTLCGDQICLGEFEITLIGCPEEQHAQDFWMGDFLRSEPTYSLKRDVLTLEGGEATLVFLDREVADPDRPLTGRVWEIDSFISADGSLTTTLSLSPKIKFDPDGTVAITTPCNKGGGHFEVVGNEIELAGIAYTKKGCKDQDKFAQEAEAAIQRVIADGTIDFEIEAFVLTMMRGENGLGASTD